MGTDRRYGVVGGMAIKVPCKAGTTAAITLSGTQSVDGVALVSGDRCLVKDQADTTTNGIYVVDTGNWTRDVDFDGALDIVQGTLITIANGTINGNLIFQVTSPNPITIGSSNITFAVNNTASVALSGIHGATPKTTPVGADEIPITDSESSFSLKKLTFTNLVTYLSGLCSAGWNAFTATNLTGGTVAATNIDSSGHILSSNPSAGIGYATGAGGNGSISGGSVTINKMSGYITIPSQAWTAGSEYSFLMNNSSIQSYDTVVLNENYTGGGSGQLKYIYGQKASASGGGIYIFVTARYTITIGTRIDFSVIRGVAA